MVISYIFEWENRSFQTLLDFAGTYWGLAGLRHCILLHIYRDTTNGDAKVSWNSHRKDGSMQSQSRFLQEVDSYYLRDYWVFYRGWGNFADKTDYWEVPWSGQVTPNRSVIWSPEWIKCPSGQNCLAMCQPSSDAVSSICTCLKKIDLTSLIFFTWT